MRASHFPIFLCSPSDAQALELLKPIGTLATLEIAADGLKVTPLLPQSSTPDLPSEALPLEVVMLEAIGFFATSEDGITSHGALSDAWKAQFGDGADLPVYDLSGQDDEGILSSVCQIMANLNTALHNRSAKLMKELSVLRRSYDETQRAHAALEEFCYSAAKINRTPTMIVPVQQHAPQIKVTSHRSVETRLPGDSAGLCDVTLHLAQLPEANEGVLTAKLWLRESGDVAAVWRISASEMIRHPLRLALLRAVGPDRQTPMLTLDWDGKDALHFRGSFAAADPRFSAVPGSDGTMLACTLHKFVANARLPLAHDSFPAQKDAQQISRWTLGHAVLRDAIATSPDSLQRVAYSEHYTGVFVKADSTAPTVARLKNVVPAGVSHIVGGIKTESDTGPAVEYAYAVVPSDASDDLSDPTSDETVQMSEWVRLQPSQWAELHLMVPAPLEKRHDLFLMTRLLEDETSEEPAASCFFDIKMLTPAAEAEA